MTRQVPATVTIQHVTNHEDMPFGHVSSTAFHRLMANALTHLSEALRQEDTESAVLFIAKVEMRFVRPVLVSGTELTIVAYAQKVCGQLPGTFRFRGGISFGRQKLLAVNFAGVMALR